MRHPKILFLFSFSLAFLLLAFAMPYGTPSRCYKYKPRGNFKFKQRVKEPRMENLNMIGSVGRFGVSGKDDTERLYGSILRTLRFQNISKKIEKKYGLPKNFLLAMVMQETGGADMLLNGQDDGGVGICHMQGSTAHEYGLRTYKGCDQLICNPCGVELRELIEKHHSDRRKLIRYDDRFHPIYNLDAAARMLVCYKYPKVDGFTREWSSSVYRYAGKHNYSKYWKNMGYYRKMLNDPKVINKVRKEFNRRNPDFTINGRKANFDDYIRTHQNQHLNYGLKKYR